MEADGGRRKRLPARLRGCCRPVCVGHRPTRLAAVARGDRTGTGRAQLTSAARSSAQLGRTRAPHYPLARAEMKVANSVRKAINEWEQGELESAMLHACNAVDGTARKLYPNLGNKDRFTRFLRENYAILGPMGAPGIDLIQTRFPVTVQRPTAPGGGPDMADVIYGIHRCCHAHGDE